MRGDSLFLNFLTSQPLNLFLRVFVAKYSMTTLKNQAHRFEFGKNWQRFLVLLDKERINHAELSLKQGLDMEFLSGKSFLDVGCGSGLFSLAARRLGADVCSFDVDHQSVECAQELRRRYFPHDEHWRIPKAHPGQACPSWTL